MNSLITRSALKSTSKAEELFIIAFNTVKILPSFLFTFIAILHCVEVFELKARAVVNAVNGLCNIIDSLEIDIQNTGYILESRLNTHSRVSTDMSHTLFSVVFLQMFDNIVSVRPRKVDIDVWRIASIRSKEAREK